MNDAYNVSQRTISTCILVWCCIMTLSVWPSANPKQKPLVTVGIQEEVEPKPAPKKSKPEGNRSWLAKTLESPTKLGVAILGIAVIGLGMLYLINNPESMQQLSEERIQAHNAQLIGSLGPMVNGFAQFAGSTIKLIGGVVLGAWTTGLEIGAQLGRSIRYAASPLKTQEEIELQTEIEFYSSAEPISKVSAMAIGRALGSVAMVAVVSISSLRGIRASIPDSVWNFLTYYPKKFIGM